MPERSKRVEEIYARALELHGNELAAYLNDACDGDKDLRDDVESLLHASKQASDFMEVPALEAASHQFAENCRSWIGASLHHYELGDLVGVGGMGNVYRARDTRLGRTVAIKVLADHISSIPEARARFEREARVIAGLNHPHICVLHDIGRDDDVDYLVMEYLDGVTLAQRLTKGALGLKEAVKIAVEIGDALDKAHSAGVVHRDLKPSNVMLTPHGAKLLDFGVAKLLREAKRGASSITSSDSDDLTHAGTIVGTPRYIAPEQLQSQQTDERADIFAFGAILYEMLSGKKAFPDANTGGTSVVVTELPREVGHVVSRCLAPDPSERWHSIRDVVLELQWAAERSGAREVQQPIKTHGRLWIAAIAAIAVLATVAAIYLPKRQPDSPTEVRFDIDIPSIDAPANFSVSPDGQRVVYAARTDGVQRLWVREINSLEAKALPGSEGARIPDWTGDGRSVVYATADELRSINVSSGERRILAKLVGFQYTRSSANKEGVVIFANIVIRKVSPSGGVGEPVTELDRSHGETSHTTPWFLPDGRHFLYQVHGKNPEDHAIYIGSLDSKIRKPLMTGVESKAVYSPPGLLLFLRGRVLMAQPFDAERLEFSGEPKPLATEIASADAQAAFYVSDKVLLYRTSRTGRHWLLEDRNGKVIASINAVGSGNLRLSPDGKRVAFLENGLWTYDLERKQKASLGKILQGRFPVWSPDGNRISFGTSTEPPRVWSLQEQASSGASQPTVLYQAEAGIGIISNDWSADGRHIIFEKFKDGSGGLGASARSGTVAELWVLPLYGERKPFLYLSDGFDKAQAVFSPDSRWIAYTSRESGSYQVFVRPFPKASGGKWQISSNGGMAPRWRKDGKELFFLDGSGKLAAVAVTTDGTFGFGKPVTLGPRVNFPLFPNVISFDVDPSGQRFVISRSVQEEPPPITVVVNWASKLP